MTEEEGPKIRTIQKPGAKDTWNWSKRRRPFTIVQNPQDLSIDELPPPGFNVNELTKEPPPKIIRRTKKEVGNYNANLTAPKDD